MRDVPAVSQADRSLNVEGVVSLGGRVDLVVSLGYRPDAARPVDRDRGPSVAVLVADVHEQGVIVVLDAHAMSRVRKLA